MNSNNNIFTEKVEITNDIITIQVECEKRTHADIRKRIYRENNVFDLIPQELKNKVILIEKPEKKVSNINSSDFVACGCWKFKINEENQETTKARPATKPRPKAPARRRKPTNKK